MYQVLLMVAMTGQLPFAPLPGYQPGPVAVAPRPPEPPAEPVDAARVPDTTDAVAWAVQEIVVRKALPLDNPNRWTAEDVLYKRFLWIPPWGDVSWHHVNSFLVNSAVSQSSNIILPDGAAGGWLIVWDLRRLAPREADLKRLLLTWDALAVGEPYFHVKLPAGYAKSCRSYTHIDGRTYNARHFVPAPHVAEGYAILEVETLSFAPLLRADYFLRRVASTIDGGLYYHFAGFIRAGHRLTEAEIFRTVGLDVLLSRGVEGDDRAAMFQSGITGKPRLVEQVQGAIGKARLTYDLFDEDVEADRHPIYELLDFVNRARGKEIIFERANGLHGFILTDGKGKLVDEAPPNLAADHRTPEPLTRRLFPPLSCIRCHGPESGVRSVRNDVPQLLGGGHQGDLDLLDDLSSKAGRFTTVDRIAGLYAAGDKFQNDIDNARIRYADSVWTATRGAGVHDSEQVAPKVAGLLAEQYAAYWYPRGLAEAAVSPDHAALELGYRVEAGQGTAFLQQALKPGRVDVLIDGTPVEFADPSIGALRRGLSIRRQDFERVYPLAAYQISKYRSN